MKTSLLPLIGLLCACAGALPGDSSARDGCGRPGEWVDPRTGTSLDFRALLDDWAKRSVVLLGESHSSREDHAWQLQVLAALQGRTPNLVIGFEAFPRRLQPVLDRWVAGELSRRQFLEQSEWDKVWGFPSSLYQPLFDFTRMHRIPMVALNVERDLVRRVGEVGWAAIPPDDREGLSDPRPASEDYVSMLSEIYAQHRRPDAADEEAAKASDADEPIISRFVEAQLTWDRAMAEAIASARKDHPGHLVVGILGRGHVEYGYGVTYQLADLGLTDAASLVTWTANRDCAEFQTSSGAAVADAVFVVAPEQEEEGSAMPRGPKLGVMLSDTEIGIRIDRVIEGSVAAASGLKVGDVVIEAAGMEMAKAADLAGIIRRQPFGTWLPLVVSRDGGKVELIAKFPRRPHPPMDGPSPHRRNEEPGAPEDVEIGK